MIKKALTLIIATSLILPIFSSTQVGAENPPILITELQTGFVDGTGAEFPKQEFIELTNVTTYTVDLTGWRLEYLSSSNTGTGSPTALLDTIAGSLPAGASALWSHEGYILPDTDVTFGIGDTSTSGMLAKSGGHVRLMNAGALVDCVAWGSAVSVTGCDKVSAAAPAGFSVQRKPVDGVFNKLDGVVNAAPANPVGGGLFRPETTIELPSSPANQASCDDIQLSEILANPAGDDAGGEFIELYNPADSTRGLYGCSLKTATRQYDFPVDTLLGPREYRAFPYSLTGLQLGNSGGVVTLTTKSAITFTTYPAVGDDQAWAFDGVNWFITKPPTPNAANNFVSASDQALDEDAAVATTAACPEGKYRNPDTGRCKNLPTTASTTACEPGQERNPETGRCRKIAVTKASAVCPAGQEKNPTTNRCRKLATSSATKACPTGQARNKETGRCRKVSSASKSTPFMPKLSPKVYNYLIVGAVLAAVFGYGLYEYRHELMVPWHRWHRKRVDSTD